MKRLLITGASSKFTTPLLQRLQGNFESIVLLTNKSTLTNFDEKVSCIKFDLTQSYNIPFESDVVIHLAAAVPYNLHGDMSAGLVEKNSKMFLNVMNYAHRCKAKRVILISSTDIFPLVYDGVIDVRTQPNPQNDYGLSKLACETIGGTLSEMYSISLSILRLGPVYSEVDSKANKVSEMLKALRNNQTISVQEPENIPSLLHVESAADAIFKAVFSPPGKYIVTGRPLTIRDFMLQAKKAYMSESRIQFSSESECSIKLIFDCSDTERMLGWAPFEVNKMFFYGSYCNES